MAVGEVFLGAFLQLLLDRLTPSEILNYFGLIKGVDQKLKKWSDTLSAITAVLNDAEEKQLTEQSVKSWLVNLRDLAYDVEDVLDKFATKMLKRKIEGCDRVSTSKKIRSSFSKLKLNFDVNTEINRITERLQEISEQKDKFGLKDTGTSSKPIARPPSSCVLDLPPVGRDDDKATMIEVLSKDGSSSACFDVLSIVGMGGLGKTTLAQFLFNHKSDAMKQFEQKVWVSVSDDFDIMRVTKAILESVTSRHVKVEEFSKMQQDLSEQLRGKKFLIVLDDVWNNGGHDLYDLWTRLRSPFGVGARGSKIVVTTRDVNVAEIMGASEIHELMLMSDGHCLKIFEQHAFQNINNGGPQNFEMLRDKIVEKCSGLPLAARTLGGLLRGKEIDQWKEILNNKLWNLSSKILPVLKLSYHYLPSYLKRCFAYCSILPNDYEFGEKQLILLWIAEGLIQVQPGDNRQPEDLGHDYFQELLSRSLFQKSSGNDPRYVMHDLVTDLARWAAGETCFRLEDKQGDAKCFSMARHSSFIAGEYDGVQKFTAFLEVKRLRTFLPLSLSWWDRFLARKVISDLLTQLQYLRVLSFNGYGITELQNSIGKLKYLRYLDVSYTQITSLPESTSDLCNLQTLIMEGCSYLKELPRNLRNLVNLRHLNNSGVYLLRAMPPQLGRLENLQSLPHFVVSSEGSDQSGITEIGPLLHLRGSLRLSRLENVSDVENATKANLRCKDKLDVLQLEWSYSSDTREMEADVLEMLQPHAKLKELTIRGYAGEEFSEWIRVPLFSNMVFVCLEKCNNCVLLPPLGQLSSLRELHIRGLDAVVSVGPEFYGEGSLPFRVLETLVFGDMQKWKKWLPLEQNQDLGSSVFPCLKILSVKNCSILEGKLPENLDSLERLEIFQCEELVVSITNYKRLCKLDIDGCKGMVHACRIEFELLERLSLCNILELTRLETGEEFTKGLRKVKNLRIRGCEELTSSLLKKNEDRLFPHLVSLIGLNIKGNSALVEELGKEAEELGILGSNKLECLTLDECDLKVAPKGFHYLTSLQELNIFRCPSLVCFPDVGLPPSLQVIDIKECGSLLYIAKSQIPQNLKTIDIRRCKSLKSLVEDLRISGCDNCLEHLEIWNCESLTSLSLKGGSQFPRALKHLGIENCEQLEYLISSSNSTPDDDGIFHNNINYCLECIIIDNCPNLKCLPEGLCHLTNLQTLSIYECGSLVSIPRLSRGVRRININDCSKLEELPQDMHNLNSLEDLSIEHVDGFNSSSIPPNLISLSIWGIKSCKALWELECGLHTLTSLRHLSIKSEDAEVVSFPPDRIKMETLLPKSLTRLTIAGFPNLKKVSKGLQFLTSLQSLDLWDCPKLASIPAETLPLSLTILCISRCPMLQERCKPGGSKLGRGRYYSYWPKLSHIPCIVIRN